MYRHLFDINGPYVIVARPVPEEIDFVGAALVVYESEDRIEFDAAVSHLVPGLIFFEVDWESLREVPDEVDITTGRV